MKRIGVGLAVLGFWLVAVAVQARMVSVAGKQANMLSGPGGKSAVLWELEPGFPLQVLGKQGGWLQVADFEGDKGWVQEKEVGNAPHVIVKKKRVNVRSGAGPNYTLVGKANHGVVFRVLEKKGDWFKVKHQDGLTGWIEKNMLWGW